MRRKRRTPAAVDNSAPMPDPQGSTYRSYFGVRTSGATSLPGPQMRRVVDPAWKDEVVGPQPGLLDPLLHGFARGRGDLELDWTLGLVLHDHGAGGHLVAVADVPDLQTDEIAASQLAVDSQVRISAIVDAYFRLIVDGVSAPSWTRGRCAQARGLMYLNRPRSG